MKSVDLDSDDESKVYLEYIEHRDTRGIQQVVQLKNKIYSAVVYTIIARHSGQWPT